MYSALHCLGNEIPMDSALNSAHFHSRRADNHLKYGRYDDAIKSHKETVNFLTKAITESTIPTNIEHLKLQREHHENIQQIIKRQKREFEDFLLRNGLQIVTKQPEIFNDKGTQKTFPEKTCNTCPVSVSDIPEVKHQGPQQEQQVIDETEFFSLCASDLKKDLNHDDNEFFSLVANLKIDEDAYIETILNVNVINENDGSDNEEYYFSLQ